MNISLLTVVTILLLISVASMLFYLLNAAYASKYVKKNYGYIEYSEKDVTAIMPVYSEDPQKVHESLTSLASQVKRIIVVVDGNSASYDILQFIPKVILLKNGGRMGKRESIAKGMSRVDTKFVLLIDADANLSEGGVRKLLNNFSPNVGGVGANVSVILQNDNKISYASEFIERSKETIMRAMSLRGSVSLLDGACAMYRTELIKDHVLSAAFRNLRINGQIPFEGGGDDSELTSIVIRKGYLATKDFDVMVYVNAKKTVKGFSKQLVRWTRNSWRSLFASFKNGTAKRAGNFYKLEMIMMFAMPIMFALALALRSFFYLHILFHPGTYDLLATLISIERFSILDFRRPLNALTSIMGSGGSFIFLAAAMNNVKKDRIKIIVYGAMASFLIFLASVYALITYFKVSKTSIDSSQPHSKLSNSGQDFQIQ